MRTAEPSSGAMHACRSSNTGAPAAAVPATWYKPLHIPIDVVVGSSDGGGSRFRGAGPDETALALGSLVSRTGAAGACLQPVAGPGMELPDAASRCGLVAAAAPRICGDRRLRWRTGESAAGSDAVSTVLRPQCLPVRQMRGLGTRKRHWSNFSAATIWAKVMHSMPPGSRCR